MIAYFDTSAVVPILIAEPGTPRCRRVWDEADRRVSSRLTYVETAAALGMAQRQGRILAAQHDDAWANFVDIWPGVYIVELTRELSLAAAEFARTLSLRGYDAVHCASAAALDDPDLVAAAGDAKLLAAWRTLGVAIIDTHVAS